MSKARARNEPGVRVRITTGLATLTARRAWAQFWQRLLRERGVSATNKDNEGEGSQTVRL